MDDNCPIAESKARGGEWCVAYRAGDAIDVLVYAAKHTREGVNLGPCRFAGRWRGGWVSTVGEMSVGAMKSVTEWVRALP